MHAGARHDGDPRDNQLLDSLPDAEWERWQPLLEPVDLKLGQVLCEAGNSPVHLFFPTTAIVSLMYRMRDGATSEIGIVGHDGVVGIALFMGGDATHSQAVVQSPGRAYRLHAQSVKEEVARGGVVLQTLLRYTQA